MKHTRLYWLQIIVCFLAIQITEGGVYWVSPDGNAEWADCAGTTDPGSNYCSLAAANANAQAGDTVYLKGGRYILSKQGQVGISPVNSGITSGNMIIFAAAPDETPVLEGTGCYDCGYGIYLDRGNSYIKIEGITGRNLGRWITLTHFAHHNEIKNCNFYSDTGEDVVQAVFIGGRCRGGERLDCYSTHNWIHHNRFSKAHSNSLGTLTCYEGRDLIRIGDPPNPSYPPYLDQNDYNTVENNYAEYAGHAILDTYGARGVIRKNVFHNEGWIPDTSGGNCTYPPMPSGKYGHRVMQTSEDFGREGQYILVEGNRLGPSSANPNNPGEAVYAIASPKCIVRYNYIFGGQQAGIYYKYASYSPTGKGGTAATDNRVYNNTIYFNGQSYPYMQSAQPGCSTCPGKLAGITHYSATRLNVDKNNLLFGNYSHKLWGLDITVDTGKDPEDYPLIGSVINNWTTSMGDPKFVNPDISNPASPTLPDLSLKRDSPAINGGTYLAHAVGSGYNSTKLFVNDAMYFQDGSWGSDLARGVSFFADWIAVGSVFNTALITSVDYVSNTITLSSPITWEDGAYIWLYKKSDGRIVLYGSSPDFGAYEYKDNNGVDWTPMAPENLRVR